MSQPPTRIVHHFHVMGGPATLVFNHRPEIQPPANRLIEGVIATLQALEARYSRYLSDSLISRINGRAGSDEYTAIDEEACALFDVCDVLWAQSGGLFDPTSGVLRQAWDFQAGRLIKPEAIADLRDKVGWEQVRRTGQGVLLETAGMELDFGGLVKEYAADVVANILRKHQVDSALIELAGDVVAVGSDVDGEPWRIGIRNPQNTPLKHPAVGPTPADRSQPSPPSLEFLNTPQLAPVADVDQESLLTVELVDAALATSGDYERCVEIDGRRYSHLLDPHTGWPVSGARSISVVGHNCLTAGAVATVGCLYPVSDSAEWLESANLPWLLIDSDHRLSGPLITATEQT